MLIISTTLSTTLRDSVWFLQLQAEIREKLAKTYLSVDQYIDMLDKHGFRVVTAMNILNANGSNIYSNYLEPESLLDEDLDEDRRQATCLFDIATDTEIREMVSAILDKQENGTLGLFVKIMTIRTREDL